MVNLEGFLSFLGFDISLGLSWYVEIGFLLGHSVCGILNLALARSVYDEMKI